MSKIIQLDRTIKSVPSRAVAYAYARFRLAPFMRPGRATQLTSDEHRERSILMEFVRLLEQDEAYP